MLKGCHEWSAALGKLSTTPVEETRVEWLVTSAFVSAVLMLSKTLEVTGV